MSVTTLPNTEYLGNETFQLFFRKNIQQQLAKEFVERQADAILQMLIEYGEVKTYADFSVEMNENRVRECAIELMDDMLEDLRNNLVEYINQIKVKVVSATFDDQGMSDGGVLVEGIPREYKTAEVMSNG